MDGHQQTMCIGEQQAIAEPIKELEEVTLDISRPKRTTRIGTLASWPVCQTLTAFLRDNQDIFAWSHKDMSRIDPSVIVHRLNVSPSFSTIWQKKQVFAQERDKAIAKKFKSCLRQISSEKCTTPIGWQIWSWLKKSMENGGCAWISRTSIRLALRTTTHSLG